MSIFFVTGTDTNVGKTVASRAIMQAMQRAGMQIVGYKPLACGQEELQDSSPQLGDHGNEDNPDVLVLQRTSSVELSYQQINSYTFAHTMPMLTEDLQRIDLNKINHDLSQLAQRYQSVLVEGSFGWLTPMTADYNFAQWAQSQKMPVVLVVGIKEGCINHALLTAQSIEQMGLPLLGWVANRINPCLGHYAQIIQQLSAKINAPLLGKIPYLHKPEEQELGQYIHNLGRLSYMQTQFVG